MSHKRRAGEEESFTSNKTAEARRVSMPCQTSNSSAAELSGASNNNNNKNHPNKKKKTEEFFPRKRDEERREIRTASLLLVLKNWLWMLFVKFPLWSYHSFSEKSLADICKKEGLAPLSPYTQQNKSLKSAHTCCTFSKLVSHGKIAPPKSRMMEIDCQSKEESGKLTEMSTSNDFNNGAFNPSIPNFFQFRINRLSTQRVDNFSVLPDEMILRVFKWLPKQAMGRVAQTCKRLKRLSEDETLWRRLDLQGRILNEGHLGVVLSRQPVFLRLARAQIRDSPNVLSSCLEASQLSYLDLSMAVISSETLAIVLSKCSSLVKLSLEHMEIPDAVLKAMNVFAPTLDTLNLTMCYDINPKGFVGLLKKCKSLKNLNLGCLVQDWTTEELLAVVNSFPSKLEQLNMAGFRQGFTDTHVEVIVSRCPRLVDLDLSDCQDIVMAIESIITLTNLQHLGLSRCYSLDPSSYKFLAEMRSLRYLEVFSFFKESALKTIKATLPGVEINQFYFSAVARPTVGVRRSSIWNIRVRD